MMTLKDKLLYGIPAAAMALAPVAAFAEGTSAVSASQMTGLVDDLSATVSTIFPSLLGLLALIIGVGMVPRLVKRFTR